LSYAYLIVQFPENHTFICVLHSYFVQLLFVLSFVAECFISNNQYFRPHRSTALYVWCALLLANSVDFVLDTSVRCVKTAEPHVYRLGIREFDKNNFVDDTSTSLNVD